MSGVAEMSTSADRLSEAFRKVGEKYGYDNVNADFTTFREFKVQWQRSYKWASFRVSDYLMEADDSVMEGLAETLFSRITGREETPYDENMRNYVLNPDFCRFKRPVYLKRSRNLTRTSVGMERDLEDSLKRLVDMGLVPEDTDIEVVWATDSKIRRAASCSVLMRLVSLTDNLDDSEIPDFVVDYCVYTQCLRIIHGAENFGKNTEIYTREDERKFPKYKEAERLLDKMCLYL